MLFSSKEASSAECLRQHRADGRPSAPRPHKRLVSRLVNVLKSFNPRQHLSGEGRIVYRTKSRLADLGPPSGPRGTKQEPEATTLLQNLCADTWGHPSPARARKLKGGPCSPQRGGTRCPARPQTWGRFSLHAPRTVACCAHAEPPTSRLTEHQEPGASGRRPAGLPGPWIAVPARGQPPPIGPDPHWPSPRCLRGQIQSSPISMLYKDSLHSFKKMQV